MGVSEARGDLSADLGEAAIEARRPDSTEESWVPPGRIAVVDDAEADDDGAGASGCSGIGPSAAISVSPTMARTSACVDGEALSRSGLRLPGSNRPVRMDRMTAVTSTPASVASSMPRRKCSRRGGGDRPSKAALILGPGPARSRNRRSSLMTWSSP